MGRVAEAELHHALGLTLFARGRYQASLESHRLAAGIDPDHAEANLRAGMLLWFQNDFDRALPYLERAVRVSPQNAEAHAWLGLAWYGCGALGRAANACERAVQLDSRSVDAHVFHGLVLHALGRTMEARECYAVAMQLDPECAHAHVFFAESLLLDGDFAAGWREYEWRLRSSWWLRAPLQGARWDGAPLRGRRLLVHAEQGFGDTLQYIRFVLRLISEGNDVVAEVQPQLLPLLRQVPALRDRVIARGDAKGSYDVHAAMLSLPHLLGLRSIPLENAYLRCDADRLSDETFNVGIAWQGARSQRLDRHRSVPLQTLLPLAGCGARLFSLQYGTGCEQLDASMPIELPPAHFGFSEAASRIAGLDLVITIDSAVAHLAGALGVPAWLMLPFVPDARWLRDGDSTDWYPRMRLFRQQSPFAWEGVVDAIRVRLAGEVAQFKLLNRSKRASESAPSRLQEREER